MQVLEMTDGVQGGVTTVVRYDLWVVTQECGCENCHRGDYCLRITPTSHLEVGKGVGVVSEVKSDMDLGMVVVGEVVVVEGPDWNLRRCSNWCPG